MTKAAGVNMSEFLDTCAIFSEGVLPEWSVQSCWRESGQESWETANRCWCAWWLLAAASDVLKGLELCTTLFPDTRTVMVCSGNFSSSAKRWRFLVGFASRTWFCSSYAGKGLQPGASQLSWRFQSKAPKHTSVQTQRSVYTFSFKKHTMSNFCLEMWCSPCCFPSVPKQRWVSISQLERSSATFMSSVRSLHALHRTCLLLWSKGMQLEQLP